MGRHVTVSTWLYSGLHWCDEGRVSGSEYQTYATSSNLVTALLTAGSTLVYQPELSPSSPEECGALHNKSRTEENLFFFSFFFMRGRKFWAKKITTTGRFECQERRDPCPLLDISIYPNTSHDSLSSPMNRTVIFLLGALKFVAGDKTAGAANMLRSLHRRNAWTY